MKPGRIKPNAAPSSLAGKQCNPWFFVASWPNDAFHEVAGKNATDKGYKNVYLMAPNYQAGKDSLAGFKRFYKGKIVDEVYTKLGQLDYSAELAQIRAAKPDTLYIFLPGSMGINFIKQFVGAGLSKDIQLMTPGFASDQDIIRPVGDAVLGLFDTSHWALGAGRWIWTTRSTRSSSPSSRRNTSACPRCSRRRATTPR